MTGAYGMYGQKRDIQYIQGFGRKNGIKETTRKAQMRAKPRGSLKKKIVGRRGGV